MSECELARRRLSLGYIGCAKCNPVWFKGTPVGHFNRGMLLMFIGFGLFGLYVNSCLFINDVVLMGTVSVYWGNNRGLLVFYDVLVLGWCGLKRGYVGVKNG